LLGFALLPQLQIRIPQIQVRDGAIWVQRNRLLEPLDGLAILPNLNIANPELFANNAMSGFICAACSNFSAASLYFFSLYSRMPSSFVAAAISFAPVTPASTPVAAVPPLLPPTCPF